MKCDNATSYMQRYDALIGKLSEKYERQDMIYTQVRRALLLGVLLLALWMFTTQTWHFEVSYIMLAVACIVSAVGFMDWIRKQIFRPANTIYKEQLIAAITRDEHPGVRYDVGLERLYMGDIARVYGSTREGIEDCFSGELLGYKFKCGECTLEQKQGKHLEVVFRGYIWRINIGRKLCDTALTYVPRKLSFGLFSTRLYLIRPGDDLEPYIYARNKTVQPISLPYRLWYCAKRLAHDMNGELTMVLDGHYLTVAINTQRDMFELEGRVTEESLHKLSCDISKIVTLPARLPLDTLGSDDTRTAIAALVQTLYQHKINDEKTDYFAGSVFNLGAGDMGR